MIWFWVVVLVLVVGAVAVVAVGRDTSMAEAYEDRPDRTIPAGRPLTAADLQTVRFSSALRGYRMDEVDALIDKLAADLEEREHEAAASAATADDTGHATHTGMPAEPTAGRRRAVTADDRHETAQAVQVDNADQVDAAEQPGPSADPRAGQDPDTQPAS